MWPGELPGGKAMIVLSVKRPARTALSINTSVLAVRSAGFCAPPSTRTTTATPMTATVVLSIARTGILERNCENHCITRSPTSRIDSSLVRRQDVHLVDRGGVFVGVLVVTA